MLRFVQKIIRNYMNNKKKGLAQSEQVPYICKSDNYSSTAACAAAKFSPFIRVLRMRCKLFASSFLYVISFLYFCFVRTKLQKITDMA